MAQPVLIYISWWLTQSSQKSADLSHLFNVVRKTKDAKRAEALDESFILHLTKLRTIDFQLIVLSVDPIHMVRCPLACACAWSPKEGWRRR